MIFKVIKHRIHHSNVKYWTPVFINTLVNPVNDKYAFI